MIVIVVAVARPVEDAEVVIVILGWITVMTAIENVVVRRVGDPVVGTMPEWIKAIILTTVAAAGGAVLEWIKATIVAVVALPIKTTTGKKIKKGVDVENKIV